MPVSCCAPGCTNRFMKGSGLRFFRFPQGERKIRWQIAMKRMDVLDPKMFWEPSEYDRLCSDHFISGSPSLDSNHPDFAPSIFNSPTRKISGKPARLNRDERSPKRQKLEKSLNNKESVSPVMSADDAAGILLSIGNCTVDKGTDPKPDPLQKDYEVLKAAYTKLKMNYRRLQNENRVLKSKIEGQRFINRNVKNSEITVPTGLPSKTLFIVPLNSAYQTREGQMTFKTK